MPLGLLALLPFAEARQRTNHARSPRSRPRRKPNGRPAELRRIRVQAPRRKPPRRGPTGTQPAAIPLPTAPAADGPQGPRTPLNTNVIAESGSRLGLTPRQIPATVEVIDKQTIQDRGLKTTTDVAEAMVGVTAGDAPGAPGAFSMRGQTFSQVNILYNGISLGPTGFTSRITDTGNLEQVEVLKGPSSLLSGLGAVGGAVNFVTKKPHTGRSERVLYILGLVRRLSRGLRFGRKHQYKGIGLSLRHHAIEQPKLHRRHLRQTVQRLRAGQLSGNGRLQDLVRSRVQAGSRKFLLGTPLVPVAFAGANARPAWCPEAGCQITTAPILGRDIDNRTLRTTYNVLDNDSRADQLWLRGGFDWMITNNLRLKNQTYIFDAQRKWFNNEVNSFNATDNLVDRERFFVAHDQKLTGNISDLIFDSVIFGMENRADDDACGQPS